MEADEFIPIDDIESFTDIFTNNDQYEEFRTQYFEECTEIIQNKDKNKLII